ncbi:unnamed protein product, partial [Polarella glacialis]
VEPDAKRAKVQALDFQALQRVGYSAGAEGDEQEAAKESLRNSYAAMQSIIQEESRPHNQEESADPSSLQAPEEVEAAAPLGCQLPPDAIDVWDEDEENSGGTPEPWKTFEEAEAGGMPTEVLAPMRKAGFPGPTMIQSVTWPILMAGRDLVGVAKTGSGKTLAFLLPCFAKLALEDPERRRTAQNQVETDGTYSPAVLVLAPSRELASQIAEEAHKFKAAACITTAVCYGGSSRSQQLGLLRKRPTCIVATVGRLCDYLRSEQNWFNVDHVRFLILDEADKMIDEGSDNQIRGITHGDGGSQRQTMMFSATFSDHVSDLASWILKRPVEIRVGVKDALRANPDINQQVVIVKDQLDKEGCVKGILRKHYAPGVKNAGKVLVFVASGDSCDELAKKLSKTISGKVETLHGNRVQKDREAAVAKTTRKTTTTT